MPEVLGIWTLTFSKSLFSEGRPCRATEHCPRLLAGTLSVVSSLPRQKGLSMFIKVIHFPGFGPKGTPGLTADVFPRGLVLFFGDPTAAGHIYTTSKPLCKHQGSDTRQ